MKRVALTWTALYLTAAATLAVLAFKSGENRAQSAAAPLVLESADSQTATAPNGAPQIHWLHSLEDAQKESKATGKPIFVDFYADWCQPCKMLDLQTYPDLAVVAESRQWVMLKINSDQHNDLAGRYNVTGLPTLVVLKADGKPVIGTNGFITPNALLQFLRDVRTKLDEAPAAKTS